MFVYKCEHCNGSGTIEIILKQVSKLCFEIITDHNIINDVNRYEFLYYLCDCVICKGTGKIDWIDNIFEKKGIDKDYLIYESINYHLNNHGSGINGSRLKLFFKTGKKNV